MTLVKDILDQQALFPNKEICGFVLDIGGDKKIWPVKNVSDNDDVFVFDSEESYQAFVSLSPVGIYHTHVQGDTTPSEFDKRTAELTCLPMYIVDKEGNLEIYDKD